MEFDKAVQRLKWRLSGNTSFKPNQNDVEAFNRIIEWISSQKEITLLNDTLFAKLYIERLTNEIRENKSTVFSVINQKEVSRVLSMPIELFYKAFHQDLHVNQLRKVLDGKIKKSVTMGDLDEKYNLDYVTLKLNHMITEAKNRFEGC